MFLYMLKDNFKKTSKACLILVKAQDNTASKTRGRKKLYWLSLEKMSEEVVIQTHKNISTRGQDD